MSESVLDASRFGIARCTLAIIEVQGSLQYIYWLARGQQPSLFMNVQTKQTGDYMFLFVLSIFLDFVYTLYFDTCVHTKLVTNHLREQNSICLFLAAV